MRDLNSYWDFRLWYLGWSDHSLTEEAENRNSRGDTWSFSKEEDLRSRGLQQKSPVNLIADCLGHIKCGKSSGLGDTIEIRKKAFHFHSITRAVKQQKLVYLYTQTWAAQTSTFWVSANSPLCLCNSTLIQLAETNPTTQPMRSQKRRHGTHQIMISWVGIVFRKGDVNS